MRARLGWACLAALTPGHTPVPTIRRGGAQFTGTQPRRPLRQRLSHTDQQPPRTSAFAEARCWWFVPGVTSNCTKPPLSKFGPWNYKSEANRVLLDTKQAKRQEKWTSHGYGYKTPFLYKKTLHIKSIPTQKRLSSSKRRNAGGIAISGWVLSGCGRPCGQ